MEAVLIGYLSIWKPVAYAAAFVGMILEGDVVIFASMFLAYQRFFSLWFVLPLLFSGAIVGDLLWFWLGAHFNAGRLPKPLLVWIHYVAEPFDVQLFSKPWRLLFLSKFTYGLRHALLMRSGMLQSPLKKILWIDLITTAIWMTLLGSLGYASGASFRIVRHYLRFAEFIILLLFLVYLSIQHFVIKLRLWQETKDTGSADKQSPVLRS